METIDRSRSARRRRASTLMKLIDALEEDDDVQTVWGNYDVPDDELEKLAYSLRLREGLGEGMSSPSCARSHSFPCPLRKREGK